MIVKEYLQLCQCFPKSFSYTEDILIEESKQQASSALAEVYFRRKVAEN